MSGHVDLQFVKKKKIIIIIKRKKRGSMYIPAESVLLIATQKSCKGLGS